MCLPLCSVLSMWQVFLHSAKPYLSVAFIKTLSREEMKNQESRIMHAWCDNETYWLKTSLFFMRALVCVFSDKGCFSLYISSFLYESVSVAQNSNLKFGMHELNFKRNIFLFATNDMHQQNMLGLIYVSTTIVNYDWEKEVSLV